MRLYNNNPAFGDCGPWDIEAETFEATRELLAREMGEFFANAAREAADEHDYLQEIPTLDIDPSEETDSIYKAVRAGVIDETIECLCAEFVAGLTQILHCDECGEDYHADAPERGHADDCSRRSRGAEWITAHTCPECGTSAPACYDEEAHPSWDCSACLQTKRITTRVERWANGCWSSCSVSTTATEDDPLRDHGANLTSGTISSEDVYDALEQSWAGRDDRDTEVEVELLDANHDQHLFRLRRVED
jgi:hypothetical protein